jgi:anti-sigma regulatory factor (Ser/Thr protein kinase)
MKFWIRNVPEHVPEAAHRISSACAKAGFDPISCHQATICAVEAINNAIVHAYREHNGYVAVRWQCTDSSLSIEVADQGAKYERRANENVVTMTKHLPAGLVGNRPKLSSGSI